MIKKGQQKKSVVKSAIKRLIIVLLGSAFAFIISALVFAIIFYFAYFFKTNFLRIAFKVLLILIGIIAYYILVEEFIDHYRKH